ncbi:hypothetical protein TREMEDRAFT_14527, partial [Tremella mesenterica DSM 1558]|uniref:uncharacterized protein n=1 Tax=Tremella mesenterica (strain ATCC 24925 / CBS 8224 / DSM 1558 / NBRC 9311 / NRRL Y-6157 / RJB 2259-6 / UBC 559-6) TaxID=578456 RepID=UPI0003F4943A
MVLINDKKFACATCIKGHRVSGCTHTDRPLFEVKKKGRPTAQCQCCRDRRKLKGSSVHSKCTCGDSQTPSMILPGSLDSSARRNGDSSVSSPSPTRQAETETRKGQPGSTPTYPNGLKDVHEMAAAAEVLGVLSHEGHMAAERQLSNLLNPCTCKTTGICKCCSRKRERLDSPHLQRPSPSRASSGAITPTGDFAHAQTSSETSPTTYRKDPSKVTGPYLSPENTHHPAHTSRHVHKTKLYSPYSTNGHLTPRHGKREASTLKAGWASSSTTARPPPPTIPPLADMTAFLGAVFREDGSVATEIPRSALGLPGINTFDAMAQNGGVKVEAMEIEGDRPISFPTSEDVVIGACTCGPDCQCPGCATHADPTRAAEHHHSGLGCGDNCKSCFDCADHLSLPSGITSIAHLLSIAAANVPPPARKASLDLDAHDTRVLPSSEDAVRSLGFVQLKPLQCCNGRCQCAPGECKCEQDCCGCCVRCNCDADGDQNMAEDS